MTLGWSEDFVVNMCRILLIKNCVPAIDLKLVNKWFVFLSSHCRSKFRHNHVFFGQRVRSSVCNTFCLAVQEVGQKINLNQPPNHQVETII